MDRRLAQNYLNTFLKTSLEASPGSICLFLRLTLGVLTDCHKHNITEAPENNMTNMQAVIASAEKYLC